MKNIFRILMAVAVLFTASCAKEDISSSIGGGEVEVTFTANLQDLGSRAYGDGSQVTTLRYYVYDSRNNELTALNGIADRVDGQFEFKLPLLKGMTYSIVFWADCGTGSIYSYNSTTKTITANYNGVLANNESLDAFYKCVTEIDPTNATTLEEKTNIVLTRPFAQLNILTKDYAAIANNGVELNKSKIVGVIPTTLNVLDGTIVNPTETETVTLGFNTLPTDENATDELTPLSMNYILAPATQKFIADITVSYEGSINFPSATYTNIPLQRNYKTNIIGKLLTSSTDFNVTIDANWEGKTDLNVWNGTLIEEPVVEGDIYKISRPTQLAWLAAAVNGGLPESRAVAPQSFEGKTFKLMNDIDLGGHNWTPISMSTNLGGGETFRGTFDGQGNTISGLVSNQKDAAGLFGYIYAATIKDLTVDGANINSNHYAGGIVAWILNNSGNVQVPTVIDNCHVKNSIITSTPEEVNGAWDNGDKVGGLVGYACFDNANNERGAGVKNCSVENTTVKAYRDFGGIAGYASGLNITNCTVENVTLEQDLSHDYKYPNTPTTVDEIIGRNAGDNTINSHPYVSTAAELQEVLNAATGESTIYLGADIEGDVTAIQKQGVKITIRGDLSPVQNQNARVNSNNEENKKYNGVIKVHSNSNYYADAALTIKNVNFETSAASVNVIEALENGSERYSNNITVENCTFTATGEAVNTSVAVQVKATRGVTVNGCTATNMHSLIQAQSCDTGDVKVVNCTVNGKNGVAFKQVKSATVEGCTITATGYGIRFDGNIDNYGIVVKNNDVTAVQPLIVRRMTGKNNTIALEGTNTLTTDAEYQIVITNGEDDAAYVKPTGTYTLTGADGYTVFPAPYPVASWEEFTAALAAGEDWIILTDNISNASSYSIMKDVILDLNKKALEISSPTEKLNIGNKNNAAAHKPTVTIKNGNLNCKVYAQTGNLTLADIKFGGSIAYTSDAQGVLSVASAANLLAERCDMANVKANAAETRPRALSSEGRSSGYMILRNCNFPSSSDGTGLFVKTKMLRSYITPLSGNAELELTNCKFGVACNIDLAPSYVWSNMNLTGCSGGFTFTISRASTSLTEEETTIIKAIKKKNNSGTIRADYTDKSITY